MKTWENSKAGTLRITVSPMGKEPARAENGFDSIRVREPGYHDTLHLCGISYLLRTCILFVLDGITFDTSRLREDTREKGNRDDFFFHLLLVLPPLYQASSGSNVSKKALNQIWH